MFFFPIAFSEHSLKFINFLSLLFVNSNQISDLQPSGPIYLTEGDPIEIPCTLDDTENYTIDDLELLYNRKSLPSEIIVIIKFSFIDSSGCNRVNFRPEMPFIETNFKRKFIQVEMKGSGLNFRRLQPQMYHLVSS